MQNFARRLMSGASLALLAFGGPQAARASSGPRTQAQSQLFNALSEANEQGYADVIAVASALVSDANILAADRSGIETAISIDESALQDNYTAHVAPKLSKAYDALTDDDLVNTGPLLFAKSDIQSTLHHAFTHQPGVPVHVFTHTSSAVGLHPKATTQGIEQSSAHNIINNHLAHFYGGYAHVFVTGAGTGSATAAGAQQSGSDNLVINHAHGEFEGWAKAVGFVSAAKNKAFAAGIQQTAFNPSGVALNAVTNSRSGYIGAFATAGAHHGSAFATGVAQGAVGQTAKNNVFNAGVIEAQALAFGANTEHAVAIGVSQDPLANKVSNSVENGGAIVADAFVDRSASAAALSHGSALAKGVFQSGHNGTSVKNVVDNENNGGKGEIAAFAVFGDHVNNGTAHAVAVSQYADGTTAKNIVYNSGYILAGALATETGAQHIVGKATGVMQAADGTHPSNYLNNEKDGYIVAGAEVTSAHTASAKAIGVYQSAVGVHSGDTGHNQVLNNDLIEAGAIAFHGYHLAATATGVFQSAEGSGKAINALTNKAEIRAVATAHSASYGLHAFADGAKQVGTGAAVSNYVDNQGFIGASAHAYNASPGISGSATAAANGVVQYAGTTFAATGVNHNKLINEGDGVIVAKAVISDVHGPGGFEADATAHAVDEVALGTHAYNSVSNHGFVGASARASDVTRTADVFAAGLEQAAIAESGKATNQLHNYKGGSIVAFAGVTDATNGTAIAQGAGQFGAGKTARDAIANSGLIGAGAHAVGFVFASGVASKADARASAVGQYAVGTYEAYNSVYNPGSIVALASAHTAKQVTASAHAVNQRAENTGSGHYTQNLVKNSGVILASAHAFDAYSHSGAGHATADARGVYQHVSGLDVYNTVINHGVIFAKARASQANDMKAFAAGVSQHAEGTTSGASASNYLLNPGVIAASADVQGFSESRRNPVDGTAQAYAVEQSAAASSDINKVYNSGTLFAHAKVSQVNNANAYAYGVNQSADATEAYNFVSNGGGVIYAAATAHGVSNAVAPLAKAYGVNQHATGSTASNVVNNDKVIIALAQASKGVDDTAIAKGVNQEANASSSAAANFVSNAGLIAAQASASHAFRASARAYGIDQHAYASSDDATNRVDNYAAGNVFAQASAYDATYAYAYAKGINEVATGEETPANYVSNAGFIGASARAHNGFNAYEAEAYAYGVEQRANGGSTAYNSVDNHLHAAIVGYATASDAGYAYANGLGIYQDAGASEATNQVANSGIVAGIALAHGNFNAHIASAYADGVYQAAFGDTAKNNVTNHGAIGGFASANSAYLAHGYAAGVDQFAGEGYSAANYVDNHGLIAGVAYAHSASYALATGRGVVQVGGGTASHDLVKQTVINHAGATIIGYADAYNADLAWAQAKGIGQSATPYADNVHNFVSNHGAILGVASATAKYTAYAGAAGVFQGNTLSGLETYHSGFANGVSNYGFIGAHAYANASYHAANAYADGVAQFADASHLASNVVHNHGTILAGASAFGSASDAYARARGVNQDATAYFAGTAAQNYVSNTANKQILADARAGQVRFDAYASATGVKQYATNSAGNARNRVFNQGLIGAYASAGSGSDVLALAKGADQTAHAEFSGYNQVTNHGAIIAIAHAHGTLTRSVFGSVTDTSAARYAGAKAYGIDQHADPLFAYNYVSNHGLIAASAVASAASTAHATAKGVNQHASAGFDAYNHATNAKTIVANAFASAKFFGTDPEIAGARAYGIDQHAHASTFEAYNTVLNAGLVSANATAVHASEANAEAKGVNQVANGNFDGANYVGNYQGVIHALADASGTDNAFSHAHASAFGIDQHAHAAIFDAYNTVSQVGYHVGTGETRKTFGAIVATASAFNDNRVSATAKAVNQTATGNFDAGNIVRNKGGLIQAYASATSAFTQRGHFTTTQALSAGAHRYVYHSGPQGGTAEARAYGVDQHANNGIFTGYNYVSNAGVIAATATASSADRRVIALAKGINQEAYGPGHETNLVDNFGLVFAAATAHGAENYTSKIKTYTKNSASVTTGGPVTNTYTHGGIASARAYGIDQHADATHAHNAVYNDAAILAYASASSANQVFAQAKGINQVATATGAHADNYVLNSDALILASARAHNGISAFTTHTTNGSGVHSHVHDTVSAKAFGVDQRANASAVGTARNAVYNDAGIFGSAYASNHNHVEIADAHGIDQRAYADDSAANYVANSGTIVGYANAHSSDGAFFSESGTANAYAHAIGRGIEQHASGSHAKNTVLNDRIIVGSAVASSAHRAVALGQGVYQYEHEIGSGEHVNENFVGNSGFVLGYADAHLASDASAYATGAGQFGFAQTPHNVVSNGTNGAVEGIAYASGRFAGAGAVGVKQDATGPSGHEVAYNAVYNIGGTYTSNDSVYQYEGAGYIAGSAEAHGQTIDGNPGLDAFADAYGIAQHANAQTSAHNLVENGGIVRASALAENAAFDNATAAAISQAAFAGAGNANYTAGNFVYNEGEVLAYANASHYCTESCFESRDLDNGFAHAGAVGILQDAAGYHAYNSVSNGRTTSGSGGVIFASANARFANDATAYAQGVNQFAEGRIVENSVSASGYIEARAYASGGYFAGAYAQGIAQYAEASGTNAAINEVFNSGFIGASASAVAGGDAFAHARATGVYQEFNAQHGSATVTNTRFAEISAVANAHVISGTQTTEFGGHTGGSQTAHATARGINIYEHRYASHTLAVHVYNSGTVRAVASAGITSNAYEGNAPNVYAAATGVRVDDAIAYSSVYTGAGYVSYAGHGIVEGTIANYRHGEIHADAYASQGSGTAVARGVNVVAREFIGHVYNAGSIDAQAFGDVAHATGIRIANNGYSQPSTGHVGAITNDGGFIFASTGEFVFRSADGSVTGVFDQGPGNAINVESAPNQVNIVLKGTARTGEIFGNIEDATAKPWTNTIRVQDGITFFDGSINPELAHTNGSLATGGSLYIQGGGAGSAGTLWLPAAGSAFVPGITSFWGMNPVLNVNSYTQRGALWVVLNGPNAGSIWANTVDLSNGSGAPGGTVGVILNPYWLPTTTTYTIVNALVTNNLGNGTNQWSGVSLLNSVSPLLSVGASYPGGTVADITLTRTPFDAIPGLTPNQEAVADGLEGGYGGCVSAACQAFYQGIFGFDAAQYPKALNMLSGAQLGEVVQSDTASVNEFVDTIIDRLNSMDSILGAGGLAAPKSDGITVWGSPYGSWTVTGSTLSGPGYANSRAGIVLGADLVLPDDPNLLLGIAGNIENKGSYHFNDGKWASLTPGGYGSAQGWDIALYGRYNNTTDWSMPFYIKGSASYGTYDNRTVRPVELPLLPAIAPAPTQPSPGRFALTGPSSGPERTLAQSLMSAKFNSTAWSIYGEGGVSVDTGEPDLNLTPFLGLRYIDSTSGHFMEHSSNPAPGIAAAALNVNDASAQALVTYLGAEVSTIWDMGNNQRLLPSVRLAWTHNFDDPWRVNAYFQGVGPSSGFTVDASSWSRDSGLIDGSLSMLFEDNLMGTIGYTANLNSTQTEQQVYGRIDFKF